MSIHKLHHHLLPSQLSDKSKNIIGWLIWFAGFLLLAGIIVGAVLIRELVYKRTDPTFSIEKVSIHGFNLTTDNHLTSFFDVTIRANNRHRHLIHLSYDRVRVSIYKDNQNLGEDTVDDFSQRPRNVTVLKTEAVALDVKLKNDPAQHLNGESEMGFIEFDVVMTATLNIDKRLKVTCKHVVVNITSAGNTMSSDETDDFHKVDCHTRIRRPCDYQSSRRSCQTE